IEPLPRPFPFRDPRFPPDFPRRRREPALAFAAFWRAPLPPLARRIFSSPLRREPEEGVARPGRLPEWLPSPAGFPLGARLRGREEGPVGLAAFPGQARGFWERIFLGGRDPWAGFAAWPSPARKRPRRWRVRDRKRRRAAS